MTVNPASYGKQLVKLVIDRVSDTDPSTYHVVVVTTDKKAGSPVYILRKKQL